MDSGNGRKADLEGGCGIALPVEEVRGGMAFGDGKVRGLLGFGEESISVTVGTATRSLDMRATVFYTFVSSRAVTAAPNVSNARSQAQHNDKGACWV